MAISLNAKKGGYKAVFFDAGGTLIYANLEEVFVDICKRYGVTLSPERVAEAYDLYANEDCDFFKENKRLLAENWEGFWNLCNERMLEFLGIQENVTSIAKRITADFPLPMEIEWKFFPEVPNALARLKQERLVLGVISNFDPSLEEILYELGLAQYFDIILTSKEARYAKPDPNIFRVALQRVAIDPEEALYVGDSYDSDVVGSRSAGLIPVLIDRKWSHGDVDCLKIADMEELSDLTI